MSQNTNTELIDQWVEFLRERQWDELGELAAGYPRDQSSLRVGMTDLWSFNADLADDLQSQPGQMLPYAEEAVSMVDLPVDVSLDDVQVRPTNLPDAHIYGVGDLRHHHGGQYVGVHGHIARVTACNPRITEAAFECQRCGTLTRIPQTDGEDFQEPHECKSCERQGPFRINTEQSEFVDQRKVQLKEPPEDAANGEGDTITVYMEGDVADPNDETLSSRVGEDATLFGTVKMDQRTSGRSKTVMFDQYLDCRDYDFERDTDDIDVAEHKDAFTEAAEADDAYQQFFESMAPDIYPYGRWPLAIRLGAAWLMGGVRVSPENGSTYRGDIHMGVIGPPGVGKSKFSNNLAELSPGCEHRSATGLSSEVGLTAAAVQDDFADGDGWVLKPGILPRAKHHAILDEADKTNAELSRMNDALEGEQMASIDKGGINAKLKTRVGLMVMANPNGGRWSDFEEDGVKAQVDIDDSLWSRFDGIVLLEDRPDESQDGDLADHLIGNYRDNFERDHGDDTDEENADVPVSWDAMRAWVKFARENINPKLTDAVEDQLREYYVEIRNDETFAENSHPTARKLEAGIRFATAFARIRLSDTVEPCDVDMAITLSKELLGQSLRDGELDADVFTEASENANEYDQLKPDVLGALQRDGPLMADELSRMLSVNEERLRDALEHYKKRGDVIDRKGKYEAP